MSSINFNMLTTSIGRLRVTGFLEGLSYLILLGIAMPLKYLMDMPQAVRVVGMAHGVLFIIFIWLTVYCKFKYRWTIGRMLWLWAASIVPFGTFYVDAKFLRATGNQS